MLTPHDVRLQRIEQQELAHRAHIRYGLEAALGLAALVAAFLVCRVLKNRFPWLGDEVPIALGVLIFVMGRFSGYYRDDVGGLGLLWRGKGDRR